MNRRMDPVILNEFTTSAGIPALTVGETGSFSVAKTFDCGQTFRFEPITLVPFDLEAINADELTAEEKAWLNDYHKTVFEKVSPLLDNEHKEYLRRATRAI